MVISLLLEQVQQHENEYVITLINPSTRNLRMALIISHQPYKTVAVQTQDRNIIHMVWAVVPWQYGTHGDSSDGTRGGWRTCRASPLVLQQVMDGLKLLGQV